MLGACALQLLHLQGQLQFNGWSTTFASGFTALGVFFCCFSIPWVSPIIISVIVNEFLPVLRLISKKGEGTFSEVLKAQISKHHPLTGISPFFVQFFFGHEIFNIGKIFIAMLVRSRKQIGKWNLKWTLWSLRSAVVGIVGDSNWRHLDRPNRSNQENMLPSNVPWLMDLVSGAGICMVSYLEICGCQWTMTMSWPV